MKTYKGYELLKAIADGEIKDGSKINISRRELFSNEYLELCRNLS